jgi:outer membrane lipoprotein-sorting protein
MSRLRTISTRRLLTALGTTVAVMLAVTALAIAATAGGPVPPATSLPAAIHQVLSAPAPAGLSGQITFTDNLLSGANLDGYTSPLITGATGRIWADADHLRLELQSASGDTELLVTGRSFWLSDPSSNTVYEGTLPADAHHHAARPDTVPSPAEIRAHLNRLAGHVAIAGPVPTDVGGQPAYAVTLSPVSAQGLLGSVQLAFDPTYGIPLSAAIYARGDSTPQLQLTTSGVSIGAVDPSVFAITPRPGAKVVHVHVPSPGAAYPGHSREHRAAHDVRVVGHGLGAILVLRRHAGGAGAQRVIATELGTLIELTRGGSSYLIVGSVKPAAAEAVAHGL